MMHPPGYMLGTFCKHVLTTFGMFLVDTYQKHGRVPFQLGTKCYQQACLGHTLRLHSKCEQNAPAGQMLGKVSQCLQCTQHVPTEIQVPSPCYTYFPATLHPSHNMTTQTNCYPLDQRACTSTTHSTSCKQGGQYLQHTRTPMTTPYLSRFPFAWGWPLAWVAVVYIKSSIHRSLNVSPSVTALMFLSLSLI